MSEEKIIDKIRKLMTLANSANEHEAALAAARATELMLKHEIAEAQLATEEGAEVVEEVERESIDESGSIIPWKGNLCAGLAQSMGCEFYYGSTKYVRGTKQKRTYLIIGQESKRAMIKYMYDYLCAELIRLADSAFRKAVLKQRADYIAEVKEYKASGLDAGPMPKPLSARSRHALGTLVEKWFPLGCCIYDLEPAEQATQGDSRRGSRGWADYRAGGCGCEC